MKALLQVTLALSSGADSLPSEIINYSLTAIASHATNADAFKPVIDQVLESANGQLKRETDWEKLVVVMKAIETVVGVKKGARVAGQSFLQPYRSELTLYAQLDVEQSCF